MSSDNTELADVCLGLAGLTVRSAVEAGGEVQLLVETPSGVVACPRCGTRAESKGRRTTCVRDVEMAGRPNALYCVKRRWVCKDPDCSNKTWTEEVPGLAPRAVLTNRARSEIARRVGEDADPVAQVALAYGVSWDTAWRAFEAEVTPKIDDPERIEGVEALGIDETAFLKATKDHPTIFATGLVDARRSILLDIVVGRSAAVLSQWLGERPEAWLDGVQVVSIDPFEAYRLGLKPHLAHVLVVADPFHIVKLANKAVDGARRRTQQELTGHRGRRGDPLYDIRKILLTAQEKLSEKAAVRLEDALGRGDPLDHVLATWLAKEHLREVYAVESPDAAHMLLYAVINECAASEVPELNTLSSTLSQWRVEILNHHRTGDSNGRTESMNLLIKQIKRAGYGFRNFKHYRLRVLAHCGLEWNTHWAAPIRGRSPHFIA